MRRQAGNNGLGIPMSFNAIEGIAVVKGAPPVMLGTTQRVGGFVNLQPKTARLTESDSTLKAQLGEWEQYRLQLDHNWVLKEGEQGLREAPNMWMKTAFTTFISIAVMTFCWL